MAPMPPSRIFWRISYLPSMRRLGMAATWGCSRFRRLAGDWFPGYATPRPVSNASHAGPAKSLMHMHVQWSHANHDRAEGRASGQAARAGGPPRGEGILGDRGG